MFSFQTVVVNNFCCDIGKEKEKTMPTHSFFEDVLVRVPSIL